MAYGTVITLDDTALGLLLDSPAGPVSEAVREYAQDQLYGLAVATLSDPWGGGRSGTNPPPGPPLARTYDMVNSLSVLQVIEGPQPETIIQVTAVHRGRVYGLILRDRGYHFLPDEFYDY